MAGCLFLALAGIVFIFAPPIGITLLVVGVALMLFWKLIK